MRIYNINKLNNFFLSKFEWIHDPNILLVTNCIKKDWCFVGGCVRDSLLGIQTYDIDITTLAEPEEIIEYVKHLNISTVGQRFGTIGVFIDKFQIEITTARLDIRTYGRKADVQFINSFEEDSKRRDFTINALMLQNNQIYDYHNGITHLQEQKIIFVGNAEHRIKEDYLRILRYIRFFVRFSNILQEIEYKNLFINHLDGFKNVSIERSISEIHKMSKYVNFITGVKIMNNIGLSTMIFGKDLFIHIPEDIDNHTKYTSVFLKLNNIKTLPIIKESKKILLMTKQRFDILKHISIIWNKTKDIQITKKVLQLLSIKNNQDYQYIYKRLDEKIIMTNIKNLEGILRGRSELLCKYYHLCNKEFDLELTTNIIDNAYHNIYN